jgi:carboxypeptidase Taq
VAIASKSAYEKLKERFARIIDLNNAGAILNKDAEVSMPKGSADDRTRQLMALADTTHALIKDPQVAQWLDEAERNAGSLASIDRRNLVLMRRAWVSEAGLPDELAQEIARIGSDGEKLHTSLRKTGDWSKMKDWDAHTFDILRTIGKIKKDKLGAASVYEALLDSFSPDLADATVAREFAALEKALPGMIREAVDLQQKGPQPIPLQGPFPQAQQAELCHRLATAMGYDFNKGRLDAIDAHPSTGGSASDVRFTVDCSDETSFLPAVYALIHECGHGLYEQGTPEAHRYEPVGATMGMAIHESQSGIMERNAAHTPEFFQFLEKQVREVFNRPDDPAFSAKNLELLANQVKPSFIRIEADELTYPAHVILRYKLEKSLIEGTLAINDLPKAWEDGMKNLLGITPPDNAKGCMQDVHWAVGLIGYFPAYALGNMIAAQLYNAAVKAHPEIPAELGKGNFKPLREWLRVNVHSKGSSLTTDELMIAATGEKLNSKYYLDHLSQRYLNRPYSGQAPAVNINNPPKTKKPGG